MPCSLLITHDHDRTFQQASCNYLILVGLYLMLHCTGKFNNLAFRLKVGVK